MKYYIGLGGIGCRTLMQYENSVGHTDNEKLFYYINHEHMGLDEKHTYVIPNIPDGTGMHRCIGKNIVYYELFTGALNSFFDEIQDIEDVQLVFVLSSFGGFGSASLLPILDYIEAITWGRLDSCHVIAFNEGLFKQSGFPSMVIQKFETNTISFVNELIEREQTGDLTRRTQKKIFNPGCTSFLIDTTDIISNDFWCYIDQPDDELQKLDCKQNYLLSNKKKCDVFISYSFLDQTVADEIADRLTEQGIIPWIATRSIKEGSYAKQIMEGIKDARVFLVLLSKNSISSEPVKAEIDRAFNRLKEGLKIIPFLLDDSELDDECQYYLCRQEMFSAKEPPIHKRINELVKRIQTIV